MASHFSRSSQPPQAVGWIEIAARFERVQRLEHDPQTQKDEQRPPADGVVSPGDLPSLVEEGVTH